MNVRTRSIIRFVSSAFCSPSGNARKRSSSSCSFLRASCRPCSKRRCACARLEVLDVAEERAARASRAFAPARPRDVDLADAAHAVLSSQAWIASRASRPPASAGQLIQEIVIVDAAAETRRPRVRADRVRDVEQRQPHLRRDVVRNRLRERVGRVLLAEPRLELLVEPPRGLHRRHDHLHGSRGSNRTRLRSWMSRG